MTEMIPDKFIRIQIRRNCREEAYLVLRHSFYPFQLYFSIIGGNFLMPMRGNYCMPADRYTEDKKAPLDVTAEMALTD